MQAVFENLTALGDDDTPQINLDADKGRGAGLGETFLALVDRVVVGEKLVFVLKDGTEWAVER